MNPNDASNYLDDLLTIFDKIVTKCDDTNRDDSKYELKDLDSKTIDSSRPTRCIMKFNLLNNGEDVLGFEVHASSEKVYYLEVKYFCNLKSLNPDGETYKICYRTFGLESCSDLWESFKVFDTNQTIIFVDLKGMTDQVIDDLKNEDFYADGRLDIPELPSVIELIYRRDLNSISLGGVQ